MLDIYSRTVNAQTPLQEVLAESFPWCAEHREALAGDLSRLRRAQARARRDRPRRPAAVLARARRSTKSSGRGWRARSSTCSWTSTRTSTACRWRSCAACAATHPGLTVVGDDFQAIYGFRAASARHILEFPEQFPGTHTVKLERNYRSTAPILAVANAVSEQDRLGFPKRLWTEREGGRQPELAFPRDEAAQAGEVCERVLAAREEGMELREQAVLFRTGHDSDLLELELTRRGIPFVKYGGLRYLEAAHVKDFIALLRLTDNPADEVSWFRLLQLLDGVGPVRARRVLDALRPSADAAPALGRWACAAAHVPEDSQRARRRADRRARRHRRRWRRAGEHGRAGRAAVRGDRAADPPALPRRRDPRVATSTSSWRSRAARADVRHFVSELVLDPPASSADFAGPPHLDEDYLVLSTVHSAKGLEWDAVHLIGAYDGNFPADMSAATEESVAEERRLFYVALTRARRRLHVYVPFRYYHRPRGGDDAHGYGQASRFLTEAVQGLFDVSHGVRATSPAGEGMAPGAGEAPPRRRIEVSVDALFA